MQRRSAAVRMALATIAGGCGGGTPGPLTPAATLTIVAEIGGRSPAEADAAIARPIERMVAAVPGVAHVGATSDARAVRVVALLRAGADPDQVSSRLRAAVPALRGQLPADLGLPSLVRRTRNRTPRLIVRGDELAPAELRAWTDGQLASQILRTAGIEDLEVCGGARARVDVVLDLDRLAALGLGVDEVVDAVGRDRTDPGGAIDGRDGVVVRSLGASSRAEIAAATITPRAGAAIRIGELTMLEERGAPDPCAAPAPAGAVVADVHLRGDADPARVLAGLRGAAQQAPPGVTVQIVEAPIRYDVVLSGGLDPGPARERAAAWRTALAGAPGVLAIDPMPPPAAVWRIDRDAATRAGVAVSSIETALAVIAGRAEAATLLDGSTRRSVYVTVRAADAADLGRVTVAGKAGPVALASLVARDVDSGRVDQLDLQPAVALRITIAAGDDADTIAAAAIARARAAAPLPAGMTATSWREP